MRDAEVGQSLVGKRDQTFVGMELLHRGIGGAGLPLADQTHIGVEIAQGTAEHHVVDMQGRVEIAGDAGEDHGIRMTDVDQMLRGGRNVHHTHAANGGDDVAFGAPVGRQRAACNGETGFVGDGDVVQSGRDVRDFFIHGADDGDCGHVSSFPCDPL